MKAKKFLAVLLSVGMIVSCINIGVFAADTEENTTTETTAAQGYPQAEVTVLEPMTLTAAEHDYMMWPSGDDSIDRPLEIVMNFKATDSLEEATAGGYGKWKTDFYLTIDGLSGDTVTADNSYLAGNYGTFGWIVIPTDGLVLENGVEYPVVSAYDANLTYEDICKSVKDFTAAIHIAPEIINKNPDIKVSLNLKMTNPADENDVLQIGETAVYDAKALLNGKTIPKAEVTVLEPMTLTAAEHNYDVWNGKTLTKGTENRPLDILMNFKALDTVDQARAGGFSQWKTDFYLTVEGLAGESIIADDSYLAGNYGTYGWIVIPTDGFELKNGVTYPIVSAYDSNITYKQICQTVKDFTAAIHIAPEIIKANPDLKVKLELKMTNPDNENDVLIIGEPAVYTAEDLLPIKLSFTDDSVVVENLTTAKKTGTLILASHNAQGVLAGIKLIPVEADTEIKIADTGIAEGNLTAVLWDSPSTMIPLCEAARK